MQKERLQKLVEEGKSTRKICSELRKSQTTICYWLKKHKLETKYYPRGKFCIVCGENDLEKFYKDIHSYCKKCHNDNKTKKSIENKKRAVEYLGGKCSNCGYEKYYGALSFHHINSLDKGDNFKNLRFLSWENIKREIDKCVLLCHNCHSERHGGIW